MHDPILKLTIELCRRPSLTPQDAGCQPLIAERLRAAGLTIETLHCNDTDNLWARHGSGSPVLVLLGHTDVVPTGAADAWTTPPFEPSVRDGHLYARGAADMKGSVAAMTLALIEFVRLHPDHHGVVGLLLTSDEEGTAADGIKQVAETFVQRGQTIDYCLVGEPTADQQLGDRIRIGRRGSLHGHLQVLGVQGHVAYPELARNPIHLALTALAELCARRWDEGNAAFPPSSLQISNLHAGTGASNVIPGELLVDFNFRFGTASRAEDLQREVAAILTRHQLNYRLHWQLSGAPFLSGPGRLRAAVTAAITQHTGLVPRADTGGGTSDGRFIAPLGAEVIELGPVNASIHQIDEHISVAALGRLGDCYLSVLEQLLLAPK
jgi:succinyl-diaminopimelate desuccinylase